MSSAFHFRFSAVTYYVSATSPSLQYFLGFRFAASAKQRDQEGPQDSRRDRVATTQQWLTSSHLRESEGKQHNRI